MATPFLHGVYLLLDEQWSSQVSLVEIVEIAAKCGVRLFQYRNKTDSMLDCYQKGMPLRNATADVDATFIVND
ncbi:MAG: thiamine phosphate synthase, partial [Nitrospinae bacterium]|nr:thiamine phosphate synthase [Nitrospinota bacterium]